MDEYKRNDENKFTGSEDVSDVFGIGDTSSNDGGDGGRADDTETNRTNNVQGVSDGTGQIESKDAGGKDYEEQPDDVTDVISDEVIPGETPSDTSEGMEINAGVHKYVRDEYGTNESYGLDKFTKEEMTMADKASSSEQNTDESSQDDDVVIDLDGDFNERTPSGANKKQWDKVSDTTDAEQSTGLGTDTPVTDIVTNDIQSADTGSSNDNIKVKEKAKPAKKPTKRQLKKAEKEEKKKNKEAYKKMSKAEKKQYKLRVRMQDRLQRKQDRIDEKAIEKRKYKMPKNPFFATLWIFKEVVKWTACIVVIASICGALLLWHMIKPGIEEAKEVAFEKLSTINENTFTEYENTEIYDVNDQLISSIKVSNYQYAKIGNISPYLRDGYIAFEDRRFLEHNGIDMQGIIRAATTILQTHGKDMHGGSTITQQLIKNTFLTQEKSIKRKLIEFFMAPELEKKYTKNDIIEFYMNSNFYGYNCYGVEAASQYYFGKSAMDVTPAEAAALIAVSNNPTAYSIIDAPEDNKSRRLEVLYVMNQEGVIDDAEYEEAKEQDLQLVLKRDARDIENYLTSYAVHCTALELMKRDKFQFKYLFNTKDEYEAYKTEYNNAYTAAASRVRTGGYKIYTSLDPAKQEILQAAVDGALSKNRRTDPETGKYQFQGGAVAINNETGMIECIVGGRGTDDEYNRGFLAIRQPGSSIKPIVVYGPAFETGRYYPSLIVTDEEISKDGPFNSYSGYRGKMPIRDAIARSCNTIAYRTLLDIKPATGLSYMEKLQFGTLCDRDNVGAIALGGFTYGVRVCDMAKAYYTIFNGGEYTDTNCIRRIEFQNVGTIYDGSKITKTRVYSADTCYMLEQCMEAAVNSEIGTAHIGKINGIVSACKTGTTNSHKDGWFCGFTPYYTCAVWVGYDMPREQSDLQGASYPGDVWHRFMTNIHNGLEPVADFDKPETIVEYYVNSEGKKTSVDTGVTGIFSSVANKKIEKTQEERDREIWTAREEAEMVDDSKRITVATQNVSMYENMPCETVDDLLALDKKYNECTIGVATIQDYQSRTSLQHRLDKRKAVIDKLREPLDEAAAIKKQQDNEEQAQKEANDAAIKALALGYTKEALYSSTLSLLTQLEAVQIPTSTDYVTLGRVANYIDVFRGDTRYSELNSRYLACKTYFDQITAAIANGQRVQAQDVTENRGNGGQDNSSGIVAQDVTQSQSNSNTGTGTSGTTGTSDTQNNGQNNGQQAPVSQSSSSSQSSGNTTTP